MYIYNVARSYVQQKCNLLTNVVNFGIALMGSVFAYYDWHVYSAYKFWNNLENINSPAASHLFTEKSQTQNIYVENVQGTVLSYESVINTKI